ncbi:MAG: cell division-specific peptidoglycan biosynthesis regulator FtsW [Thermoleophilia bacterium]|nr:cell division-specific peptidoglycan biosynthesis regulator FtsW [Thermoleophilia bacterium]
MAGSATRGGGRGRRKGQASAPATKPRTRSAAQSRPDPISLPKVSPVTAALGRRRLVVLIAITLYVFGLVMVASASSGELLLHDDGNQWALLRKQAIFGAVGLTTMWVMMRVPLELVRRMARPAVWTCAILVVAVMVPGVGHQALGATRWINLGFFQLQPSEPLKLSICVLLAAHLARVAPPRGVKEFLYSPGGAAMLLAGLLVGLQSDLGSGLIVGSTTIVLFMLAGTRWKLLWRTIGPAVALVVLSIVTEEYRRERFLAFLDPWASPYGDGFQLMQALLAIGSGGPFGVGLGHSVQKITFLPEAHTDMIFAIVVEELGLFGVTLVLGAFVVLAAVGTRIAMRARTRFSALLAAGITSMIVGQAAVNLAGVTGVMPLTGIPLPLVSYGGSSLIITLASLGLLANIATERRPSRSFVLPEPIAAARAGVDDLDDDSDDFDFEDD